MRGAAAEFAAGGRAAPGSVPADAGVRSVGATGGMGAMVFIGATGTCTGGGVTAATRGRAAASVPAETAGVGACATGPGPARPRDAGSTTAFAARISSAMRRAATSTAARVRTGGGRSLSARCAWAARYASSRSSG
jgi:hypothetical protein